MKSDKEYLKQDLKLLKDELTQEFLQTLNISNVTSRLVNAVDEILIKLYQLHGLDVVNSPFCLIGLGSYGRRELQLHSDIDILILHTNTLSDSFLLKSEQFIQDCWDIGLEVSQQVSTPSEFTELASKDIGIISSFLDARMLCGRYSLYENLQYQTHPLHIWASHDYFFAKEKEQKKRYEKFRETAYNLEPNVKLGVGGLRDIQTLASIGKRHFGIKKLSDCIGFGFITPKEYEELINSQSILFQIRFALHIIAGKKEDRLLFDYQSKLAKFLGYKDTEHTLAIEQFMKSYFKVIKRSRELNEILLQWFSEVIVFDQRISITPIDEYFQLSNQYIEVKHSKIFQNRPLALLEVFLQIAKNKEIKGVRANTIRLIRQHLYLIDKAFCSSFQATQIFLDILRTEHNPYEALQRMSRYGVLGYYLKPFAQVTGQMQYDLFHVFTVDQHTLFVIRNIGRFLNTEFSSQFKLASQIIQKIDHREVLYLAALFHDIGKGRGGDHSELGAQEAEIFASRHHLPPAKTTLLVWLVKHHLLMSTTSQRKDIYDPETIQSFCRIVPNEKYLDYLYLLTIADICATNPSLWNGWKDSLLKELYFSAQTMLSQNKKVLDEIEMVDAKKEEAQEILVNEGVLPSSFINLWKSFKGKYFLHESPQVIARHTKAILNINQFPLVLILPHHSQGSTEVFVYMPHSDYRFAITTALLNNHFVTIQEATISTCKNNFDLDTYIILDRNNQALKDQQQIELIQKDLTRVLSSPTNLPDITNRRISRVQAHFQVPPKVTFQQVSQKPITQMFLITADRPGLLAKISQVFLKESIQLHNAKIATVGERVEDMFYISNKNSQPLSSKEQEELKERLTMVL